MNEREEFEKRNPVPVGAEWNKKLSGYFCGSSPSVEHPFNDLWECFCDGLEVARDQDEARDAVPVQAYEESAQVINAIYGCSQHCDCGSFEIAKHWRNETHGGDVWILTGLRQPQGGKQ